MKTLRYAAPCFWLGGLVMSLGSSTSAQAALKFQSHLIAPYPDSYQVAVADMNGDGRPDVLALSTSANRVDWFQNPGWQMHPLARTVRNIDLAPRDLNGDGLPEVALASGFYFSDSTRGGRIQWFERPPGGGTNLWTGHLIGVDPVVHRLRWGDLDGDGRVELVHAPIFGPGSNNAIDPKPSHLWAFRPPADLRTGAWKVWKIDETLTVLHCIYVSDLDGDGRDEILTASFQGVYRFDYEGDPRTGRWVKTQITRGTPPRTNAPGAHRGASEVAPGRLKDGRRFIATIEPWHGNLVVVYTQPKHPGLWDRHVIDDSLNQGHALIVADFDGDGTSEIIAGWRGHGGGLALYQAEDASGEHWRRQQLDRGIQVQGAVAADFNGDGRLDFVASGGGSNRVVWYEQLPGGG